MVHSIKIKNYRVFKDEAEFKIKPITILTGPNSSGKSSYTKFLRLLKGTFETTKGSLPLELDFIKSGTGLGNFNNVLSQNANENELQFKITLKESCIHPSACVTFHYNEIENTTFKTNRITGIEYHSTNNVLMTQVFDNNIRNVITDSMPKIKFDYFALYDFFISYIIDNFDFILSDKSRKVYTPFHEIKPNEINTDRAFYSEKELAFNDRIRSVLVKINETSQLDETNIKSLFLTTNPDFAELKRLKVDLVSNESVLYEVSKFNKDLSKYDAEEIYDILDSLIISDDLKESMDIIIFLQKNCKILNRIYDISEVLNERTLDSAGNYMKNALWSWSLLGNNENGLAVFLDFVESAPMKWILEITDYFTNIEHIPAVKHISLHESDGDFLAKISTELIQVYTLMAPLLDKIERNRFPEELFSNEDFLEKWLTRFSIANKLSFSFDGRRNSPEIILTKKNRDIYLRDIGYGSIQVASIIFKMYTNSSKYRPFSKDSTLIFEEPETSLHPNFQSLLADLFVDAKNQFSHKLIIETHSEYLIRKMQYLVASGQLDPNDIIIYYFDHPDSEDRDEGAPQIREIEIDKHGILSQNFGKGFFDEADNIALKLLVLNQSTKN